MFIKNKTGCGTQMTVPVCWRSRTHGDKSKEWEAITMKYAVLSGNERFEIREGELKSNGCAVLQVTHVGVCGTDTSYWHEGERYRGVVIGHEYSGVVVAPGTNRALKPGDRVAGYTQTYFRSPAATVRHAWLATGTTAPTAGSSPGRAASWAIPALTASTPPGSPTVWSSFRIM